jgi:hypothetical protein
MTWYFKTLFFLRWFLKLLSLKGLVKDFITADSRSANQEFFTSYEILCGIFNDPFCIEIIQCVRFEAFTAVTMKNIVFWDVALCTSCFNRLFGGMYRLHLQGRRIGERGTSVSRWLRTIQRWLIGWLVNWKWLGRTRSWPNRTGL